MSGPYPDFGRRPPHIRDYRSARAFQIQGIAGGRVVWGTTARPTVGIRWGSFIAEHLTRGEARGRKSNSRSD